MANTYQRILDLIKQRKAYFCLIDPDKLSPAEAATRAAICAEGGADAIMVGGSVMLRDNFEETVLLIKQACTIPVLIFPGIFNAVSPHADAILYLSMLSSRNPQMLIGEQVKSAPLIKKAGLETISTAYLLVESGKLTSVQYMSNSLPLPADKPDIAVAHAIAAQQFGFKMVYLEAGSGAQYCVNDKMIKAVKSEIDIPLIVGGGIRTPLVAAQKAAAGADIIVTGTILENSFEPSLIKEFAHAIHGAK